MVSISRRALVLGSGAIAGLAVLPAWAQPAPSLTLTTPDGRAVPVHIWPAVGEERGRILFSHGALSAPWKYEPLVQAWTQAGYAVYAPLHVDSTDHPQRANFSGLASWPMRFQDVRAVSAHLGGAYIAAGHSYGALIALCLGGASPAVPPSVAAPLRDPRAKIVLAFSPPGAGMGLVKAGDYASLAVPALIQTGDKDVPPGAADVDWRSHLLAYDEAAPGGDRYGLVLEGVDHYFGGAICRPELPGPKQTAAMAVATDLSVQFIRAYAGGDAAALKALKARVTDSGPAILSLK